MLLVQQSRSMRVAGTSLAPEGRAERALLAREDDVAPWFRAVPTLHAMAADAPGEVVLPPQTRDFLGVSPADAVWLLPLEGKSTDRH